MLGGVGKGGEGEVGIDDGLEEDFGGVDKDLGRGKDVFSHRDAADLSGEVSLCLSVCVCVSLSCVCARPLPLCTRAHTHGIYVCMYVCVYVCM